MTKTQHQLSIRQIIQETKDAITIEFDHPKDEKIPYKPGQFFTVLVNIEGESLRRAYSLCTSPLTDEYPAITVKRVDQGKVSNFLHDNLKQGDTLEVLPPMGVFTTDFEANQARHLILFGGGSGITPLMAILKTALQAEPQTIVSLIYANRDQQSIIFQDKINELKTTYSERFNIVHILEKAPLFWSKGYKGRVSTKVLKKILQELPQKDIAQTAYFMCGPSGMMNQITTSFQELSLPIDQLKKESFGISPEDAAQKEAKNVAQELQSDESEEAQTRKVKVIYAGEEYEFEVTPDKTILESAQSLDIDLPYSCQSGMCTACMGLCISGKVQLDEEDALTPKELEKGYVLTCVGHPVTDDVIIQID